MKDIPQRNTLLPGHPTPAIQGAAALGEVKMPRGHRGLEVSGGSLSAEAVRSIPRGDQGT